jgi:aspartate kinase
MLLAYGFLRKIFEVFEKYRTPIDMITTSEVAVSLTIDSGTHLEEILRELYPFGEVEVVKDQTIIAIVGNQLTTTPHVLANLFAALNDVPVGMVSFGATPHNVSILVPSGQKINTLQLLNSGLFGL